jgi:hypothetical protein|nr:MAG TPA: hypothetical protein [Caudoviricetes sp.]
MIARLLPHLCNVKIIANQFAGWHFLYIRRKGKMYEQIYSNHQWYGSYY